MSDLDESIREAGRRYEPPDDWLERTYRRADQRRRNRRLLAAFVGASIALAVIAPLTWVAWIQEDPLDDGQIPATPGACAVSIQVTNWWGWEGSGADVLGGRDAQLHGDATFEPGFVGQALTLDGDGDYADVADDPGISFGSDDFTLMLWVKFNRVTGEQVMLEDWVQRFEQPSAGWSLVKRDRRIALFLSPGGPDGGTSVEVDIPPDTWVHLAVHRSGDRVRILMDGTVIVTARIPPGDLDSASSLKCGHRGGLNDTPGAQLEQGFYLDGQIDEVMLVVGRALSPDEIATVYREQSACSG